MSLHHLPKAIRALQRYALAAGRCLFVKPCQGRGQEIGLVVGTGVRSIVEGTATVGLNAGGVQALPTMHTVPFRAAPLLAAALAHKGPVVVDAIVKRQELSMPPHIELQQAKGFSLYALKAMMNGRGTELVELAKTNLFR